MAVTQINIALPDFENVKTEFCSGVRNARIICNNCLFRKSADRTLRVTLPYVYEL